MITHSHVKFIIEIENNHLKLKILFDHSNKLKIMQKQNKNKIINK